MKAILFDLDGVFYQGEAPIPGAAQVAAWVKQQNIPHLFLTNTTSRPRSVLTKKLAGMGIESDPPHILTPPAATINWLKQHNIQGKLALFMKQATQQEFKDFEIADSRTEESIAAVIIGDLGEEWDYATLNHAFRLLMQTPQPKLIALGMTRYWKAEDGLRLDVAPFIAALQNASGIEPIIIGKPSPDFYQAALDILQVSAEETVMIGDDIRGDIHGAQSAGLKAIQVKTGKFRQEDLHSGITPNAVLDSVCDLPKWWQQQNNLGG